MVVFLKRELDRYTDSSQVAGGQPVGLLNVNRLVVPASTRSCAQPVGQVIFSNKCLVLNKCLTRSEILREISRNRVPGWCPTGRASGRGGRTWENLDRHFAVRRAWRSRCRLASPVRNGSGVVKWLRYGECLPPRAVEKVPVQVCPRSVAEDQRLRPPVITRTPHHVHDRLVAGQGGSIVGTSPSGRAVPAGPTY